MLGSWTIPGAASLPAQYTCIIHDLEAWIWTDVRACQTGKTGWTRRKGFWPETSNANKTEVHHDFCPFAVAPTTFSACCSQRLSKAQDICYRYGIWKYEISVTSVNNNPIPTTPSLTRQAMHPPYNPAGPCKHPQEHTAISASCFKKSSRSQ